VTVLAEREHLERLELLEERLCLWVGFVGSHTSG
jgi:hypothetical protein